MLRKVLKYDLKAIYKIWLILSATALALSVICGICLRSIMLGNVESIMMVFSILGIVFSIIGICAYAIGIMIVVLVRYYTNFFTDEGYLTFTLPVKRKTLFNSKLLNAFIWDVATGAVITLCVIIVLAITPVPTAGNVSLLSTLGESMLETVYVLGLAVGNAWGWVASYTLVIILLCFASYVFKTLMVYCCVTVGCVLVKKYKVLVAVGILYLGYSIISVGSYIVSILLSLGVEAIAQSGVEYTGDQIALMLLLVLVVVVMLLTILSTLLYKFTVSRIRGNLNLA